VDGVAAAAGLEVVVAVPAADGHGLDDVLAGLERVVSAEQANGDGQCC